MKQIATTRLTRLGVFAAALAAAAVLNGCAIGASQPVEDSAAVSTIKKGVTNQQDILTKFGSPSDKSTDEKGNSVWHYQRVRTSALGFIPGLNMLGQSQKNNELTIRFNAKGVVTNYDYTQASL